MSLSFSVREWDLIPTLSFIDDKNVGSSNMENIQKKPYQTRQTEHQKNIKMLKQKHKKIFKYWFTDFK